MIWCGVWHTFNFGFALMRKPGTDVYKENLNKKL